MRSCEFVLYSRRLDSFVSTGSMAFLQQRGDKTAVSYSEAGPEICILLAIQVLLPAKLISSKKGFHRDSPRTNRTLDYWI